MHMLEYLMADPDKGLLGFQPLGLTTVVQYWRSFDHLEAFARNEDDPHLAVWRNYWKRVGGNDRSGIWHETYLVRAGEYEGIYGNMPPHGLGKASRLVPASISPRPAPASAPPSPAPREPGQPRSMRPKISMASVAVLSAASTTPRKAA